MRLPLDAETYPIIAGGLLGLMNVDQGPTDEQMDVFEALAEYLLKFDSPSARSCAPLTPSELEASLQDAVSRRFFVQLAIILELCHHPKSEAQLLQLEAYSTALDIHGPQLDAVRDLAHKSANEATADFLRVYDKFIPQLSELQFSGTPGDSPASDRDFFSQIEKLQELPYGTLGWGFLEFYRRNTIQLPDRDSPEPGYYICHDMNHVISGYEPTGPGEIALGAFKLAMDDSEANWMASMVNLLIHEVGLFKHGEDLQFVPYGGGGEPYHGLDGCRGALSLPGASDLLAEAFARGSACTADFSQVDHLAIAHLPLVEIRHQYHVLPLLHSMIRDEDENLWPT